MTKKRLLSLFLCLMLVLPVLAFSVSASEVYTFKSGIDDSLGEYMIACAEEIPEGLYTIVYHRNGTKYVSKDPVDVQFQPETLDGMTVDVFYSETVIAAFPLEEKLSVIIVNIDGRSYFEIYEKSDGIVIELVPFSSGADPIVSVSDGLTSAIGWVGTVTTSLLSGELNGLLLVAAIPIAISVVLLTVKIIKKNSWGV